MLWEWEVDGAGSGSCPTTGFCFSHVEPSSCATRVSFNVGCGDGRWVELTQDRVQSWAFVLEMLSRLTARIIILASLLITNKVLRKYPFPAASMRVKRPRLKPKYWIVIAKRTQFKVIIRIWRSDLNKLPIARTWNISYEFVLVCMPKL